MVRCYLLFFTLFSISLNVNSSLPAPINVKCYFIYNWAVYDLNQLSSLTSDLSFDTGNYKIKYNFCRDTLETCINAEGNKTSQIISINTDDRTCNHLAGSADNFNEWTMYNQKIVNQSGLSIKLNGGDKCLDGRQYTVYMNITCDPNQAGIYFSNINNFDPKSCVNTLVGKAKNVCPVLNLYAIAEFIDQYAYYIGVAMILIGIILTFFGTKFISATIYIGCVLIVMCALSILVFDVLLKDGNQQTVWIVGGVSIVMGLILGYLFNKMIKIFFTLFGAYLGYIVGILLYNLLIHKLPYDQKIVYWSTIGVCAVIFIIVSFILFEYIIIFSTSLIGSYLMVRGVSLYAGGFPSESVVINLIKQGEINELDDMFGWKVYLYLGGIVLFFIFGVLVQSKFNGEENKKTGNAEKGGFYIRIDK